MARASTPTLLSLDRFAKILGINPVHFAGADTYPYFPLDNRCSDLWTQYGWQHADAVSKEELGLTIRNSELMIAKELGWWPAPTWTSQELVKFPRHYRKNFNTNPYNIRNRRVSVHTQYRNVIAPGRKVISGIETGIAVDNTNFTDEDGDGLAETFTITASGVTTSDVNEMKLFFAGKDGAPEWEIRPVRTKELNAAGDEITFTCWSWQLIDPSSWERFPNIEGDEAEAIDLKGLAEAPVDKTNLVDEVDVYRVYHDTTAVAAQLVWEPSISGSTSLTEQDGTFSVRNAKTGAIIPVPATYDEDEEDWIQDEFSKCRTPDWVKLWYKSGAHSQRYLNDSTDNVMPLDLEMAIAQLTVSQLEREFCTCGNTKALARKWQEDIARMDTTSYNLTSEDMNCPFGTNFGAILAWRVVRRYKRRGYGVQGGVI